MGGCVFAARVPVVALLENLEDGLSIGEFLDAFEGVTHEQVVGVLEAARHALAEKQAVRAGFLLEHCVPSRCAAGYRAKTCGRATRKAGVRFAMAEVSECLWPAPWQFSQEMFSSAHFCVFKSRPVLWHPAQSWKLEQGCFPLGRGAFYPPEMVGGEPAAREITAFRGVRGRRLGASRRFLLGGYR